MCGIAGVIAYRQELVRTALPPMVAAQTHRGPDDAGESHLPMGRRFLGLGHRRLSILDLSAAGHQPMVHPHTGDQLIFNGEIYNFALLRDELQREGEAFAGHSDTEVLLHGLTRWGPRFIARLQGMFAFAFYNAREQSLLLARDSVGIKPLYIAQAADAILFASEVRSILASGLVERKLDRQAVAGLLAYGAVQEPLSIFQGVAMFPPGCYRVIGPEDGLAGEPARYWRYPTPDKRAAEEEAARSVARTLDAAVRDHLVADVPVGVFLSSGLDSTVIAGLAARHTPQVRSFTVGFTDQPDLSELAMARQTALQFGLDHEEIIVNNADAEAECAEWLDALDQPSMDGLNVYIISRAVRRRGIKVALSGQGGDELFGGYPSFRQVPRVQRLMHRLRWMPAPVRSALAAAATLSRAPSVRQKFQDMASCDGTLTALYFHRRRAMSNAQLSLLGVRAQELGLTSAYQTPQVMEQIVPHNGDAVWLLSRLESQFYQGNVLLRDGDANGMAHSLEIRVPLLDQRMLDLMLSLPGRVRLPPGKPGKHLLRRAFPDLLRAEVLSQPKRTFTLPIRRWMMGPLRPRCEAALEGLKRLSLLDPRGIDAIWKRFLARPELPIWSRAFTLVVLGSYVERVGATA